MYKSKMFLKMLYKMHSLINELKQYAAHSSKHKVDWLNFVRRRVTLQILEFHLSLIFVFLMIVNWP